MLKDKKWRRVDETWIPLQEAFCQIFWPDYRISVLISQTVAFWFDKTQGSLKPSQYLLIFFFTEEQITAKDIEIVFNM